MTATTVTPARRTTGTDVRVWIAQHRASHAMTQKMLADLLGYNEASVKGWCTGIAKPPPPLWRALEHLADELARGKQSEVGGRD